MPGEDLCGTWNLKVSDSENLDTYLKALQVGFMLRKLICFLHPDKTISVDPVTNEWSFTIKSTAKTMVEKFKMDEESVTNTKRGEVKNVYKLDGNKITKFENAPEGSVSAIITHEASGDTMTEVCEALTGPTKKEGDEQNIVCKRVYKRV